MNAKTPATSVESYLSQLRAALTGADPSLLQDALYDAEEYLRSELAAQSRRDPVAVLAELTSSYGTPDEVAEIYRQLDINVARALEPPRPPQWRSALGRFFAVAADPRTYTSVFYMIMSLVTGTFYFTWTVAGWSLSISLPVLIIGIPFIVLFIASTRLLSLVEGRIVETLLGERMPRRPSYSAHGQPFLARIGEIFSDTRTWSTCLYMLLMLPLGAVYFSLTVAGFSVALTLIATPVVQLFHWVGWFHVDGDATFTPSPWLAPLITMAGITVLIGMLHLVRAIGRLHGKLAKHLLVKVTQSEQAAPAKLTNLEHNQPGHQGTRSS